MVRLSIQLYYSSGAASIKHLLCPLGHLLVNHLQGLRQRHRQPLHHTLVLGLFSLMSSLKLLERLLSCGKSSMSRGEAIGNRLKLLIQAGQTSFLIPVSKDFRG